MANILDEYLRRPETAKQLNKCERTLERWEQIGVGPPVTRIGKEPYYYIPSLKEWLRAQEKQMPREASRRRPRGAQPIAA